MLLRLAKKGSKKLSFIGNFLQLRWLCSASKAEVKKNKSIERSKIALSNFSNKKLNDTETEALYKTLSIHTDKTKPQPNRILRLYNPALFQ